MINQDSIVTIVFAQPNDPTPQPVELQNVFQFLLTSDNETPVEAGPVDLPDLKFIFEEAKEA